MPEAITFTVRGMEPKPQGSKRSVGRGVMVESCRQLKPWRAMVTAAAIESGAALVRGPVALSVVFVFCRPAGHFRKNGTLKPSAPRWHAVRPDLDKICRSIGDSLSKVLYEDDARIVSLTGEKRYAVGNEPPGAIITLVPLQAT
jgi:crossover junction endodeoxyribonuclease RusA